MSVSWILAAVVGLLTSAFVVDQYLGISSLILTMASTFTMYRYKKQANRVVSRHFYLICIYMVLLSLVMAVTTVPVIRFWTGVILVALLLVLAVCENTFIWPRWLFSALRALFGAIARMGNFFTAGREMTSEGRKRIGHVLIGVLVSIPILAVAAGLLASADQYMNDLLENLFEGLEFDDAGVWVWRGVLFVLVASAVFGYSAWFAREQETREIKEPVDVEVIPATVSGTVLVLLNCLYLVFAYIQIRFLFFGTVNTDAGQYNYAEYARSGFFELVVLAMLNIAGILIINRFTRSHRFNHISLTVTAVCTFIMIASSWYKMFLYEQAYGYTQLRLYVYMILAFMIVFMALITLGIWKRQYRVVEWAIVIGLCYFLVIGFVNVDSIIVTNNMERYYETGQLDLDYLINDLSEDAVTTLIAYLEEDPEIIGNNKHEVAYRDFLDGTYSIEVDAEVMKGYYEDMKKRVLRKDEERQFFEFNLRHSLAAKAAR